MNDPDFHRRLRETFQTEASEHLQALSRELFDLETVTEEAGRRAVVERIFRETHTLKGAARMVNEGDAEALCHVLEQQLSVLKHEDHAVSRETVRELQDQVAAIARTLGLPADAGGVSEMAASARGERTIPTLAASGQIRVSGTRLEELMTRAEELLSAKLTGDQRVAQLRELGVRGGAWKVELERVREDLMVLRRFVDSGKPSPLMKELRTLVHYLDWNQEFTRTFQRDVIKVAHATGGDQLRLGTMIERLLDESKEVLMQPVSALLEVFPHFVREIAAQQGKEIELQMEGAETEIDRRVLEELRDALVHLVRNAIDHGIEPADERRRQGKAGRGLITIVVQEKSGGNVEIAVSDDGRGIEAREVTASARRLGIIAADAPELSDHDALPLLFASGFSTRAAATDLSGRGLGLAIVREKVERIGGAVNVESTDGRGTTFRFLLPITLARFRGVFVSAQKQTFVVPSPSTRRVLRLSRGQIRRVENQEIIELDGSSVVLLRLSEILGMGTPAPVTRDDDGPVFAIVVESGRSRVALQVDDVPHEQEVVMKSLGRMLQHAPYYVGATIVGGGQIVPVLNVSHLLGAAVRRTMGERSNHGAQPKTLVRRKRTILVAEDSITSRSLLKNILQTAGFEVRTAVDGADALTTLKFESIDLLISDVQMPRMDGFELTAKVRADKALSTIPVILITSLASRDDKARGVDAGANAYIVKSSFDQSDLLQAIGRLIP